MCAFLYGLLFGNSVSTSTCRSSTAIYNDLTKIKGYDFGWYPVCVYMYFQPHVELVTWKDVICCFSIHLTMTAGQDLQNASFAKTALLLSRSCDKRQGRFWLLEESRKCGLILGFSCCHVVLRHLQQLRLWQKQISPPVALASSLLLILITLLRMQNFTKEGNDDFVTRT